MTGMTRREFMRGMAVLGLGALTGGTLLGEAGCSARPATLTPQVRTRPPRADEPYLVVVRHGSPETLVQRALQALGGIERFVHPGDEVIIKPNICVAYHTYEYAATTNPWVVGELVRLCLGAGAKRVRVMDHGFGGPDEEGYIRSGIQEAVTAAGGEMELMSRMKYVRTAIPQGRDIKEWAVYQDILQTDVLINVPIAKHHSLARLTLGAKNLMGVIQKPNQFHRNLGQRVADLLSLVRPTLTVVDAVRILVAHGPTGGSLEDVKQMDTIIASHDTVAADAYAATLFGLKGEDIAYVKTAAAMGLGTLDLSSVKVVEISAE